MATLAVTTKDQLQRAIDSGVANIRVTGTLAKDLQVARPVITLGGFMLFLLATAIVATPFTAGLSDVALLPLMAMSGMEMAVIIAAVAIGLSLVLAVYKGYDVESGRDANGNYYLNLRRK